jgi:hypothetical protein
MESLHFRGVEFSAIEGENAMAGFGRLDVSSKAMKFTSLKRKKNPVPEWWRSEERHVRNWTWSKSFNDVLYAVSDDPGAGFSDWLDRLVDDEFEDRSPGAAVVVGQDHSGEHNDVARFVFRDESEAVRFVAHVNERLGLTGHGKAANAESPEATYCKGESYEEIRDGISRAAKAHDWKAALTLTYKAYFAMPPGHPDAPLYPVLLAGINTALSTEELEDTVAKLGEEDDPDRINRLLEQAKGKVAEIRNGREETNRLLGEG